MSTKRKIAVAVTNRAPYGRLRPVLRAIRQHPDLELQIIVATPAALHSLSALFRHGEARSLRSALSSYFRARLGGKKKVSSLDVTSRLILADGFEIAAHVPVFVDGGNLRTMTKSVGLSMTALPDVLLKLQPDILLVHADRFEMLPFATAAALMNIPVAHTQGGDVSGTIDETIRHAITKLSTFHFPTTEKSKERVLAMGEDPNHVFCVGCPTIDALKQMDLSDLSGVYVRNHKGWGDAIDFSKPFVLVMHHPVTTEYLRTATGMEELLEAVRTLNLPTIIFSPNIDAGTDKATSLLRSFINEHGLPALNVQKNFKPDDFYRVLNAASVAIGNSSSFIREGSYLGTPAVLVGSRQAERERAANVVEVGSQRDAIVAAARSQLAHGRYPTSALYGTGAASTRIAEILATVMLPPPHKKFHDTNVA